MKIFLFILMLAPITQTTPNFAVIARALSAGDAARLAEYFDENVELIVLDEEGIYSKKQAEQIVKKFFVDYPPKSFKLVHKGTNNDKLHYCIGNMKIGNTMYRVSFYMKQTDDKTMLIQELGIEEE